MNTKKVIAKKTSNSNQQKYPEATKPAPVTPKMLVKALKSLKKKALKGLFFTPIEVAYEIQKRNISVQQDLELLIMEVSDKLICAAASGIVGTKYDLGYYALDFRQKGAYEDSRSELMFWVFYKKLLNKKLINEKNKMKKQSGPLEEIKDKSISDRAEIIKMIRTKVQQKTSKETDRKRGKEAFSKRFLK